MARLFVGPRLLSRWTLLLPLPQHYAALHQRLVSTSFSQSANAKRRVALSISKLTSHGDGVGTFVSSDIEPLQVIVPFTASGDTIQAEIWERDVQLPNREKSINSDCRGPRQIFGQLVEVLEVSKDRARPLCKQYFGVCGGCKLQHVRYQQQLREKQQWILDLLSKRQHSPDMVILDILGAPIENEQDKTYHYRNKMEFTCSTGRWLLDEDKSVIDDTSHESASPRYPFTVGMFPVSSVSSRRSKHNFGKSKARRRRAAVWSPRIISIEECLLQNSACNHLLQQIVEKCKNFGLKAYDFNTHEGFLKQIVLRRGVNGRGQAEIMLGFVTTEFQGGQSDLLQSIVQDLVLDHEKTLLAACTNSPHLVSIVESLDQEANRHRRRKNADAPDLPESRTIDRVLYGKTHLTDIILGHTFEVSFDSFFQPNSVQASVLYREIQQMIAALPEKPVVWDLFCGVGSIGICMGAYAKKVVGFELLEAAVERAKANARLNGYTSDHMYFFRVDLAKSWQEKEFLETIASHSNECDLPDLIIVDPPRAGLHKKLIRMLRRLAPRHICYVSCNPHSQVVDLEALCAKAKVEGGEMNSYKVQRLQPVDMLPHTPHVETMAWLERCD